MSSEVVPDLLSGAVAIGTLALAAATYSVVRVTRQGAVDAGAHRVVVTQFWVQSTPRTESAVAPVSPPMKPGTSWDLTQYGDTKIGLRAIGHLRNEGSTTARLRIECDQQTTIDSVTGDREPIMGSGPMVSNPLAEQEGWYLVPPGGDADFAVSWWRSGSEWAKTWQLGAKDHSSAKPPPTNTVRLTIRGAVAGGARDECTLRFGAYVLVPRPGVDGWVIADNSGSRSAAAAPHPSVAEVGLIHRAYPRKG